jgi:hypothetical protein
MRGVHRLVGLALRATDPGEFLAQGVGCGAYAKPAKGMKPLALTDLAQELGKPLSALRT